MSAMDLSYEYFLSRIDFIIGGENVGEAWGPVPLLDFTASMKFLRNSIEKLSEVTIGFTENDHVVRFLRYGEKVEVYDSWASGVLECGKSELITTAAAFVERVLRDISTEFPGIQSNAFFTQLGE